MYLRNAKYGLCIMPGKIATENEISSHPAHGGLPPSRRRELRKKRKAPINGRWK